MSPDACNWPIWYSSGTGCGLVPSRRNRSQIISLHRWHNIANVLYFERHYSQFPAVYTFQGFLPCSWPSSPYRAVRRPHCHLADLGPGGRTHLVDPLLRIQSTLQDTCGPGDDSAPTTGSHQSPGARRLWSSCYEESGEAIGSTGSIIRTFCMLTQHKCL
jgi:hypothetical protein